MTGRKVWTRPGGHILAWQQDGWPVPADHIAATIALFEREHGIGRTAEQLWPDGTWLCHGGNCDRLAHWRTDDTRTRGYYCDRHLPHAKPTGPPTPTCHVCTGPLDPVLAATGDTTHITCEESNP